MPVHATDEAHDFWEKRLRPQQRSRSLAASRFVSLAGHAKDSLWRGETCRAIRDGAVHAYAGEARTDFQSRLVSAGASEIFAKLEARLIINANEGVVENGGISLDRTTGVPFVPGSAVKACARRYALQQLGEKSDPDPKARLLADLCEVFGYADQEWKPGRKTDRDGTPLQCLSDFWLTMIPMSEPGIEHDTRREELWTRVAPVAAAQLRDRLGLSSDDTLPRALAGRVAFLPAFPQGEARVETDVLTPHHPDYYKGARETATDDENPVPIEFPTIASGTTFRFLVHSRPMARPEHQKLATRWLADGLQHLGLGAKTNAGYGWFSLDQVALRRSESEREENEKEVLRSVKLAEMDDDARAVFELSELDDAAFAEIVRTLSEQPEETQKAACELLATSKSETWKAWCKPKAKKWTTRLPGIRETAKQHGIDLP